MEPTNDPFFAPALRARRSHPTSAGACELPILYTDASLLTLVYPIDPGVAAAHVDGRAFEPWALFGRAWAVLCAFEYRETSIGPYGELGVGVLVKRKGASPSALRFALDQRKERDAALFVTNLPVTTERARAAGAELWGYPKYVSPIETEFRPNGVRIALGSEFEITMPRAGRLRTRGLPIVLFSVSSGRRVLRTIVETDSTVEWGGASGVKLALRGDGPTAKTVRAFGLHERAPVLAFRTDHLRSILPAGEDVGIVEEAHLRAASEANGAVSRGEARP